MFFELDTQGTIEIKGEHSRLGDLALTVSRKHTGTFSRRGIGRFEARRSSEGGGEQFQCHPLLLPKEESAET